MNKPSIMLFIDRECPDPESVRDWLKDRGYPTEMRSDAQAAYAELTEGGALRSIDVLIIHKDLGKRTCDWELTSDGVCDYVHDHYPWIRIGIVSGEFPEGTKHVEKMKADFYFDWLDFDTAWMKEQLEKGSKSREEIEGYKLAVITGAEQEIPWYSEDIEGRVNAGEDLIKCK